MQILTSKDKIRWNTIIKSFEHWDIYYLCEYVISMEIHGDGNGVLIYYENKNCRLCYVMMQKDISNLKEFSNLLKPGQYYDLTTPYGYGGPLLEGNFTKEVSKVFFHELESYCLKEHIITQFFRFHPILNNQTVFVQKVCTVTKKRTVYIDLTSPEQIFANMDTKNRNMVRKAKKNNVTILCDQGEHLEEFISIYKETMENNNAEPYYFFEKEYFEYLLQNMKDNIKFFYAVYDQSIISAAIFFYNDQYMHYHLSGLRSEYRKLASTNLLLYEAALWGYSKGIKKLHLGGGMKADDSLFGFKKQFNKKGYLNFAIGKEIFDETAYQELINLRKEQDPLFDDSVPFLILYRA